MKALKLSFENSKRVYRRELGVMTMKLLIVALLLMFSSVATSRTTAPTCAILANTAVTAVAISPPIATNCVSQCCEWCGLSLTCVAAVFDNGSCTMYNSTTLLPTPYATTVMPNNQPTPVPGGLCETDQSCPKGENCDYFWYQGSSPSCALSCLTPADPGQSPCGDGESICSPISASCEPGCSSDGDCAFFFATPHLAHCVTSYNNFGYCVLNCSTDVAICSDWDTHLVCGNDGTCRKSCYSNNDCGRGQQCLNSTCAFQPCTEQNDCQTPGFRYCYHQSFCIP